MTKNQKILSITVILVVIIGGVLIFINKKSQSGDVYTQATTTPNASVSTQGSGSYKIEPIPLGNSKTLPLPIPDLNRPVVPTSSVSKEAILRATEAVSSFQATLKKDPSNVLAWIDLGIYQKMAGDYKGTEISWTYATKLSPTSYIAFGDLGNLYGYFLNAKAKSEIYYKKAIANGPTEAYLYVQLAEVYRDIFQDISKVKAIIDQGLTKIPNDPTLLQMKASFK